MSIPKNNTTNVGTIQNSLEVYGRSSQVRKVILENVDKHSHLDFSSIKPPPHHLPVDGQDTRTYGEFASELSLQMFIQNKLLDTKAMERDEKNYLRRHREIKAGPYLRSKEVFLEQFGSVLEQEFHNFCRFTRPFSSFAAFWCLDETFGHYHYEADSFLEFLAAHEEAYLQKRGDGISMASWNETRERFRQAFYQTSPAFKDFLIDYWGTPGPAENGSCSYNYSNSVFFSFTTEGGIPDKVVSELADKYPGLHVVHYWNYVDCPQICGCKMYPQEANE